MSDLSRMLTDVLRHRPWCELARPEQLPPPGPWVAWLLLGGRGSGKTRACAEWLTAEVMAGRARRIGVVSRTAKDTRDVTVEGDSGLLAVAPPWFRPTYEASKNRIAWPNGATATLFSADEPDALRGPQFDSGWVDELCAFERPDEVWSTFSLALRLGQSRVAISTTPRPIPLLRALVARAGQDVALTRMRTYDNLPNLSPAFAADIVSRFAGTHLGRQELDAELLVDVPGALWNRALLERTRVHDVPRDTQGQPLFARVVVGVDPSVSATGEGAETGIVVVASDHQHSPGAYVLEDCSVRASPDAWARRVMAAFRAHQADRIVVEANQGNELVRRVLQTVDPSLPLALVHASRNKQARAEPVAALYEQGRVHHVGVHADLEEQLCGWTPGTGESPDRLDALVWAVWALLIVPRQVMTLEEQLAHNRFVERTMSSLFFRF